MSTADIYISVDCEASGPFPGRHALLSVGAVVVRRESGAWRLGDSYYAEWAPPPGAEEEPDATAVHGLSWAHLQQHGMEPRAAAAHFARWVEALAPRKRKPFFVGYNAAFDWAFLLHAFGAAGVANPFHHAAIDLKSAVWGAVGGDWLTGSSRPALARLTGHPAPVLEGHRKHHAGDDAREQALLLLALLEHQARTGRRPP